MNEVIQAENNWVVFDLTVTNSLKVNLLNYHNKQEYKNARYCIK